MWLRVHESELSVHSAVCSQTLLHMAGFTKLKRGGFCDVKCGVILFTLLCFFQFFKNGSVGAVVTLGIDDVVEVCKGDSATIHCRYNFSQQPSMLMVQWFVCEPSGRRTRISYSDPTIQWVDKNTSYTERINVMGYKGGESLTVVNATLSDERAFFCQIDGLEEGHKEGRTLLKVFDTPEPPVIQAVLSGISVTSTLPSKIATCETRDGYPMPNITWYRNYQQLRPQKAKVNIITLVNKESSGLYTVQSELSYKVLREDKDAQFTCRISYFVPGAVRTLESRAVSITVHYPSTNVDMWRESPKGLVKEGDTVVIRCRGDGNPPPPVGFTRKQPEGDLDSSDGALVLREVTRGDSGTYLCHTLDKAKNIAGFLELTVHYLDPAVVVPKESVVMLKGENLMATCNASSSLDTETVWCKNGVQVGHGHTLHLYNATFDTAGHYDCEVTVPSVPGLRTNRSVHIIVHGAPQLPGVTEHVEVQVGKWVHLKCEATGFPRPVISWSSTDSTQGWQEVATRETEDGVQSMATFKVTTDTVITCNATNVVGTETRIFAIKSNLRPSAVDNGVIILVLIVIILPMAILGSALYLLYKKGKLLCGRCSKPEITMEATNKDEIAVEMKADKTEESVLLKSINRDKMPPTAL